MQITLKTGAPATLKTGCLVIGVAAGARLTGTAAALDRDGVLARLIIRGDFEGKLGQTFLTHDLTGTSAERVLLVGLGKQDKVETQCLRKALIRATLVLAETGAADAVFAVGDLKQGALDDYWLARPA